MSLLTPSNLQFEDKSDRIKFLLIWRLSVVFAAIFFLLSALFYFDSKETFLSYLFAFIVSVTALIYLAKFKTYRVIFFFYAISGTLIINASMILILDAPHFVDFLWILLGVLLVYFGLGTRWGFIFMIINLIPTIYFLNFQLNEYLSTIPLQSTQEKITITIEVVTCMLLISYIIYQFVRISRVAELQLLYKNKILEERNEIILKSSDEKTILVKEIHHRVKNNLQIIISLLRLQMTDVKNPEAKKHFSEAINRIMVMSSIHQKLYRQEEMSQFDLQAYITELAKELKQFYIEDLPVTIEVNTACKTIDLKTIVPLGLMLNELISNSFKYAFREKESGKVLIEIKDKGEAFLMNYEDNGIWKEVEPENKGFGLELIDTLTEQLNGTMELNINNGTHYTFELRKLIEYQ